MNNCIACGATQAEVCQKCAAEIHSRACPVTQYIVDPLLVASAKNVQEQFSKFRNNVSKVSDHLFVAAVCAGKDKDAKAMRDYATTLRNLALLLPS